MNAAELYKSGRLAEAIVAQLELVKADPLDLGKRLFLFELSMFAGDLDRARRQIDSLQVTDPGQQAAVLDYRRLIDAELARRNLFKLGSVPGFFGEPSEHLRLRLEAVHYLREGSGEKAMEALSRAAEATPRFRGQLNGQQFETLCDADDLFSGILEVMALGGYFWAGLEQVEVLTMNPPAAPRDLLFVHARMELGGGTAEVFLPALYPGTHEHSEDQIKLGRVTDWNSSDGGPTLGVGQHTYLRDDDAISLLDWREYQKLEQ
jgi:type VI secretion system protein ImpE